MNSYKNPLEERYSSEEMLYNFSPEKITIWGNINYVWAEGVSGQGIGGK